MIHENLLEDLGFDHIETNNDGENGKELRLYTFNLWFGWSLNYCSDDDHVEFDSQFATGFDCGERDETRMKDLTTMKEVTEVINFYKKYGMPDQYNPQSELVTQMLEKEQEDAEKAKLN